MKKMIVLFICFLVFVVLSVFVRMSLNKDVEWITAKTTEIESQLDDFEAASEIFNELQQRWEERLSFWGSLLPHNNLEEISVEIKKLGAAISLCDKDDTLQAVAVINVTMEHLLSRNTLRLDHIF